MICDERVVAAVPARGGSTTVPRKNVRTLGGKPLVVWPIDVAHDSSHIDRTIVTTDDEEIASTAEQNGAEVVERPPELATDDALVIDALRHLTETLRADGETATYLVMLEPTCPFRTVDDVNACLDLLTDDDRTHDSVATFTEAELSPHRYWDIDDGVPSPYHEDADPWLPRQQQPTGYELTGAVYAFEIDALPDEGTSLLFDDPGAVLMPRERAVDIDTELDFRFAELLLEEGIYERKNDFDTGSTASRD